MKTVKKVIFSILAIILVYTTYYFVHSESVDSALLSNEELTSYTYEETSDYYFFPAKDAKSKNGIIIYQGAKVKSLNYARIAHLLQDQSLNVYIAKMPFTWSFLDQKLAGEIINTQPDIENWYLGGHSLGGAMISNYVYKHPNEKIKGIFFMGSYPSDDFSSTTLPMLYIFGSEDGLVDEEKQASAIEKISNSTYSEIHYIDGGNHAGFGNYGAQAKDNPATISTIDQQIETVDYILKWISSIESDV